MTKLTRYLLLFLPYLLLSQAQIYFQAQEEEPAPLLLGNVATQVGITPSADLVFTLLSRQDLFEVDKVNGDFRTVAVLDRESLCGSVSSCVVTASVAIQSSPDTWHRYNVNVTVLDVNDQRPFFRIASFPASLGERTQINTIMSLPLAFDDDYDPAFKVQKYYLDPESHPIFDLVVRSQNRTDGYVDFDLYLRLTQPLDRESVESYTLTLVASDNVGEGRLQIVINVIDENDNQPVFEKPEYKVSVKEVTKVGTTILNVRATDADIGENGRVGYEFLPNTDRSVLHFFDIDRTSGNLKLIKSLEKEGAATFTFKIKAFDYGGVVMSSETSVQVAVEDTVNDKPIISISNILSRNGSAVVSEDAVVGSKVAFVDVTDPDLGPSGETKCAATGGYFSMQEYTSRDAYTISVARSLDREKMSTHLVVIQCSDRGLPPLTSTVTVSVLVDDVNDNPPIFTRKLYEMRVRENVDSGLLVGNIFASDADEGPNAVLRYSIEPNVVEFEINESNGFIYTTVSSLDRELKDRYSFEVYAFDTSLSPLTATATVVITIEDVNDEVPKFENSSYRFQVSETTPLKSVIGKVLAHDRDLGQGGVIEYLFIHSPFYNDPPFAMPKDDGIITVTQQLDYESTKHYSFVVTALDQGRPPRNSSVEVEIDVLDENDNDPVIAFPNPDNLSVTLNLDVTPGQEIIKVIAYDSDSGENGRLTYSLSAHNSSQAYLFRVNEDTGLVTLLSPLSPAEVRSYNIVISVNDNGVPQRATQTLLRVEIVQQHVKESRHKESYTTIVIIMVCVTLFVAVVVLVTLCFIKYLDKRKFDSEKDAIHKSTFEPVAKASDKYMQVGAGDEDLEKAVMVGPCHQRQVLVSSSIRNGKKSVTFDSAVRTSDISAVSDSISTQPDSGFGSVVNGYSSTSHALGDGSSPYGSNLTSTFNPGSLDSYNTNSAPRRGLPASSSSSASSGATGASASVSAPLLFSFRTQCGTPLLDRGTDAVSSNLSEAFVKMAAPDKVVNVALQNHNALVRSLKDNGSRRSPYPHSQLSSVPQTDHELSSSSSIETSDSGHGSSDLDVSVIKANV